MGLGGIGMSELIVILAIVVLLFGTKRLGSIGADLGSAIRGFRNSMKHDEDAEKDKLTSKESAAGEVIEGQAKRSEEKH
jgi:sec-independent protein translocase protein TatA